MLEPLFFLLLLVIVFKIYQKMTLNIFVAEVKMVGKVVIITGANSGIGYETAKDLAKRGAKVILACRDKQKGEQAALRIIKATKNPNVHFKQLDLTSFRSVREFAHEIKKTERKLHILINNAGTGLLDNSLTKDNLPIEAQVNHFSPFLLTLLLCGLLKSSAPSRIINVSSVLHKFGTIENLDKQAKGFLERRRVYCNTKLANILFSEKLSRYIRHPGVTVNCLHPGAVDTEMFRNQPRIIRFLIKIFFLTPKEGAQSIIYLAAGEELETVTGLYFSNCNIVAPSKKARDKEEASRLWKMSTKKAFGDEKFWLFHKLPML